MKFKYVKEVFLLYLIFLIFLPSYNQDISLLFDHLTVEDGLSQNTVTAITKDRLGFVWIATFNGLNRYDGYNIKVYKTNLKDTNSISNNRIVMLIVDDNGTLWAETFDNVLNRYNYETDDFSRIPKNKMSKRMLDSLEQKKQNLGSSYKNLKFFLTGAKFRCINNQTGKEVIYSHDPLDPFSIGDNYVNFAYVDNQNILWLGTNNGGAQKVDLERHPFYHYKYQSNNKNSLLSNNIRSIFEDSKGLIWVGTRDEGITRIDRKKESYEHLIHENGNKYSLMDNRIRKIYEDKYGDIWVGTIAGLCKYDTRKRKFFKYTTNILDPDISDRVNWIMEDHNGELWAGTAVGICRLDRETNSFITFKIETKTQQQGRVRVILEDKQNNFWLGCDGGGLIKLVPNPKATGVNDHFISTHYILGKEESSISDNRVYTLCEDGDGEIWIGTACGLNRMDTESGTLTHFTDEISMPDNMILGILNDQRGHLWISHKRGITRLNTVSFSTQNYTIYDGLQGIEFNEDAYFRSSSGEMFFGGTNGFNSFYPESISNNEYLPKIAITDFKILNKSVPVRKEYNGRVILEKSITYTDEVLLKYVDRSIQLEFAALHFSNPQANMYKYMLEGFDDDWISTDANHRIASYSNLKPKTYTFKVIASNNDGEWNLEPATLQIVMLPPWWNTMGFKIAVIIVILILMISIYILKVSSFQKQKLLLEQKVAKRTAELKSANVVLENQKQEIERSYNNIKVIGDFGQKLTSTLDLNSINSMIFDYVKSLMEVTHFGIGIHNEKTSSIDFPVLMENGSPLDGFSSKLTDKTSCAAWSFNNNKVMFCNNFSKEYSKYITKLHIRTSKTPESLIYIPLHIEQKNIGILIVQSEKKSAYSDNDFSLLQMLASYIAIALDNANVYQQLEERNSELKAQTEIAKKANTLLIERQQKIEEQSMELKAQANELNKTNLSLKTLNAQKDKLFSIIAHDLKNPFGTILGFSEMLVRKFDVYDSSEVRKFIKLIYKSTQNIFDLLQNLLQWARSQTGNLQFDPEYFDLKELIEMNISLIKGMLKEKDLKLKYNTPEECNIYADLNMISTVVRNLITNAVKFTEKGKIDINTIVDNGYIMVSVSDTGIGIREEKLKRIFDYGNTLSMEGTRGESGTGLGLMICKEFVEKNGGEIKVKSEAGKGSTFSFTVPRNKK